MSRRNKILFASMLATFNLFGMQETRIENLDLDIFVDYDSLNKNFPYDIKRTIFSYIKTNTIGEYLKVTEILYLMHKDSKTYTLDRVVNFIEVLAKKDLNNICIIRDDNGRPKDMIVKNIQ